MMKKLLFLLILIPTPLIADARLASVSDRGLSVSCIGGITEGAVVQCSVSEDDLALIDVFQIASPARVVMDLEERPRGKSFKKTAVENETLAGIRTGWHPDKYRIVFDMQSDETVTFSWRKEKNTVHLLINSADEADPTLTAPEIHAAQRLESGTVSADKEKNPAIEATDARSGEPSKFPLVARSSVLPANEVKESTCVPGIDEPCTEVPLIEESSKPQKDARLDISPSRETDSTVAIDHMQPAEPATAADESSTDSQQITVLRPTALSRVALVSPPLPAIRSLAPEFSERQDIQPEVDGESLDHPATEELFDANADAIARARMNPALLNEADSMMQGQVLHGISFSVSSDAENSVVHLKLNQKPHFNLSKLGPRTYRLRILDCSLKDDSLTLPFFPPHTFPRVSFLQAEPNSGRTEVTIGVERGTRLMAVSSDNGIDIKVVG